MTPGHYSTGSLFVVTPAEKETIYAYYYTNRRVSILILTNKIKYTKYLTILFYKMNSKVSLVQLNKPYYRLHGRQYTCNNQDDRPVSTYQGKWVGTVGCYVCSHLSRKLTVSRTYAYRYCFKCTCSSDWNEMKCYACKLGRRKVFDSKELHLSYIC